MSGLMMKRRMSNMPFGIPSKDFHGGFGLPHDDDYDPYTGKYAFVSPDDDLTDEEYEAIAEEANDNLVRALIEAGGEINEARELLARSLEMLYILGYDSGLTNPAIDTLTTDIKKFLEGTNETLDR
jgi:hypothetical protein